MKNIRVLSVASEVYPLVKTGGLGDVTGALPRALGAIGVTMRTLIPGYPDVIEELHDATQVCVLDDLPGGSGRVLEGSSAGLDLFVLDAPQLFARQGNPYVDERGNAWPDNAVRFGALCAAAAAFGHGRISAFHPDVVHAHDWQAGLVPAYLHYGNDGSARTLMTVHNLAFQGQFTADLLATLKLPPQALSVDGVEYHGGIGFLKAGLALADWISTVSPTYAMEIQTPSGGMGLDGLLRKRTTVLSGILNGIDTDVWNPATDMHIAERYDAHRLGLRAVNKAVLQQRFGLEVDPHAFVFGVVGRLTWQKGVDLLEEALPKIVAARAQFALLGAGDPEVEVADVCGGARAPGARRSDPRARRNAGTCAAGGLRRTADAFPLRAVRTRADVRDALRHDSRCGARGRTRRHRRRRQRDGACPGRGHRRPICAGNVRADRNGDPARAQART